MDRTDQELITQLAGNARMPVATLARKLGVARTTVQARLERLERSGVIAGYTLRLGAAERASRIRATALLTVEPRETPGVLQRLRRLTEVEIAHTTSGRFDLLLELSAETTAALDKTLDQIGSIPGVRSSESLIHLSTKIDRAL